MHLLRIRIPALQLKDFNAANHAQINSRKMIGWPWALLALVRAIVISSYTT